MGCKTNCAIFVLIASVSVAVIPTLVSRFLFSVDKPPLLELKQWWGRGQETDHEPEGTAIKEFSISLSNEVLNDLKERLARTYFFENLEGIDWEYGINPDYVKELVEYWRTKYDWRSQEEILNTYKHYKTKISGLDVHFLHYKPEVKEGQRVLPIMFIHGWPGSFYEFYKVIPKLIAASTDDYAFSVICPSIPGYGLSEAPHKPGFEPFAAGRIFCKLMERLGYESYYIQGGDWGSAIARAMALMNPSQVRGLHLNYFGTMFRGPLSYIQAKIFYPEKEQKKIFPVMNMLIKMLHEGGYFLIQATRPHSVALATNDSPAGLAAYIMEKFAVWSGCSLTSDTAICLESCFTKDELLTNVMIYWITHSIASSMRLYYETMHRHELRSALRIPITVPVGFADFPHELLPAPEPWIYSSFLDVVQYTEMPRGGHFAAFGEPEIFSNDVIQFVEKVEKRIEVSKEASSHGPY